MPERPWPAWGGLEGRCGGVYYGQKPSMEPAVIVAIFVSLFVACVPFMSWGKDWAAEQEKARERRMAAHRMNARLLRFDI
jgi:DNA topoisomerase VI subunit B